MLCERILFVQVGEHLQTEQKETKVAEKKVRELTAWLTNVDESTQVHTVHYSILCLLYVQSLLLLLYVTYTNVHNSVKISILPQMLTLQQEVGSAIEAITELRAEVDRQKTVM